MPYSNEELNLCAKALGRKNIEFHVPSKQWILWDDEDSDERRSNALYVGSDGDLFLALWDWCVKAGLEPSLHSPNRHAATPLAAIIKAMAEYQLERKS